MTRSFLLFIVFIFYTEVSIGQNLNVQKDSVLGFYLDRISKIDLEENLSVLAADSLRGRETGKLGQKKAAQYLKNTLIKYNVIGAGDSLDYFQRFALYRPNYQGIFQIVGNDTLRSWRDLYTFSTANDTVYKGANVTFLGFGIESENYSDYHEEISYEGLGVLFMGEPYKDGLYLLSGTESPSEWSDNIQLKIDIAKKKGLSGLVVINERFDDILPRVIYYQKNGRPRLNPFENSDFPVVVTSPEKFNGLFKKMNYEKVKQKLNGSKKLKNYNFSLDWSINYLTKQNKFYSENVLGILEGKQYPDEYVFMTAHYDHLGQNGEDIYNGADDDGSGTSALLEIARLFSLASDSVDVFPKRSIVFLWVSGEEKGLLGSKYYTDNPIYPLDDTVVDLNIDMVGRRDSLHTIDDSSYVYLIGSDKLSSDLHTLSEQVNEIYSKYDLDYTYNDDSHPSRLYYRSDHYNFAKNNIPVIFYFGGMHEDYHLPSDELEKIDFDILSGVTRLVMSTSWHIATLDKPLEVDNPIKLVR